MTVTEHLVEHLRLFGPMTTKQIASVFGWTESRASGTLSKGVAYGALKVVGTVSSMDRHGRWVTPKRQHLWAAAHQDLETGPPTK